MDANGGHMPDTCMHFSRLGIEFGYGTTIVIAKYKLEN